MRRRGRELSRGHQKADFPLAVVKSSIIGASGTCSSLPKAGGHSTGMQGDLFRRTQEVTEERT